MRTESGIAVSVLRGKQTARDGPGSGMRLNYNKDFKLKREQCLVQCCSHVIKCGPWTVGSSKYSSSSADHMPASSENERLEIVTATSASG